MKNLIIKLPDSFKNNESYHPDFLYEFVRDRILERIKNKKLIFIQKYKNCKFVKQYPYNTFYVKNTGIYNFIKLKYIPEGDSYYKYINFLVIIKNNTVILNPIFFVNNLSIRKYSNDKIVINYCSKSFITCLDNIGFNNQINLLSPVPNNLSNNKVLFKKYLFDFISLICFYSFDITSYINIDIIMPFEYKNKIIFINDYLKIEKINEIPFKNNNSSNKLFYFNEKINYYG